MTGGARNAIEMAAEYALLDEGATLASVEREFRSALLRVAWRRAQGVGTEAAKILDIHRNTFHNEWLKVIGV